MSRLAFWSLVLILAYALNVWGWLAFGLILFVALCCYFYYKASGRWPWVSAMSAISAGISGNNTTSGSSISESRPKKTFADVAGIDEVKEELLEIVDFLKNKDAYLVVGARLPRGVLLVGPPGVGKTLCAKAIAGEAGVSMVEMAGSSFVNKYVGVGASSIRALFERAKVKAPCIVFIDEFDSLGKRGSGETDAGPKFHPELGHSHF